MTDVPDLAEPIAAWRVWRVVDDGEGPCLMSPIAPTRWPVRAATTATCRYGCTRPPSRACSCGLYALRTPPGASQPGIRVLACVALWGRVVEATDGWRGQHGYPLVLFVSPLHSQRRLLRQLRGDLTARPCPTELAHDAAILRLLAERYAVPAFPVPSLEIVPMGEASARAAVVRDEAVGGLAARRRGDASAQARLTDAATALVTAMGG